MSHRAYVLRGPFGCEPDAVDEQVVDGVVARLTFVDRRAGDLDQQQLAQTEDVGTAEQPWRRRWRAVATVGSKPLCGWGKSRAEAVEALRGRLGAQR